MYIYVPMVGVNKTALNIDRDFERQIFENTDMSKD